MFNYAVYADRESRANARQAESIKLDRLGNAVNSGHNGRVFTISEVIAAQQSQSYAAYQGAMTFLDTIIGDERDTATRKAFDQAKAKFVSVGHAEEMKERLMVAALNGSNAALIAYAAACVYLNPYAVVDFSWFVSGSEFVTVDHEGYEAATTGEASQAVSVTLPSPANMADYEGFATTYRTTRPAPVMLSPTTPQNPAAPVTLKDEKGRVLVATATGWKAESKSSPGSFHHTSHDGSTCTCRGFNGRYRKCWHTATVRAYVAQQESQQQRLDRANALPVMPPRRRGKAKMWK